MKNTKQIIISIKISINFSLIMEKTVFISGLPYSTSIEQVEQFFEGKQIEYIFLSHHLPKTYQFAAILRFREIDRIWPCYIQNLKRCQRRLEKKYANPWKSLHRSQKRLRVEGKTTHPRIHLRIAWWLQKNLRQEPPLHHFSGSNRRSIQTLWPNRQRAIGLQ